MERFEQGRFEVVGEIVLDNSVIVPLIASDEDSAYSERVFRSAAAGTRLLAPALCVFEFGNAVLTCVRRERMTMAQAWRAHEIVAELPIEFGGGLPLRDVSAIPDRKSVV